MTLTPQHIADAAMVASIGHQLPMRAFKVQIGRKPAFECMATDSCACVMQHIDLAEPGERVAVEAIAHASRASSQPSTGVA
jgi:hypothetical protein